MSEEIILYDSDKAAKFVTGISGWVSAKKHFYGTDENLARYDGCTHKKCECGNSMERHYTKCSECRHKSAVERYNSFPFKEWDGTPVVTWDGDKYFFSEEELWEYCDESELEEISLLFCQPNKWHKIDADYWSDEMPENSDGELPKELQLALDNLNAVIETLPPQSYSPGKIRTTYKFNSNE